MIFDNNALKPSSKFDSLQQDIHSSALLTKQNIDQLKTPDIRHGFTLGSLALLVPKNVKSEIIYAPTLYPLPNTPNWFSGFANHRGEALPIFYLEGLLNPHTLPKKNKQ
jgi:chemotaxis signal transduction protein